MIGNLSAEIDEYEHTKALGLTSWDLFLNLGLAERARGDLHAAVFRRKTFSPSAFSGFRKILQWASFNLQTTEAIEELGVHRWNQADPHLCGVHEVFALIVADQN